MKQHSQIVAGKRRDKHNNWLLTTPYSFHRVESLAVSVIEFEGSSNALPNFCPNTD
jgi:hypothetical protein